MTNKNTKKEHSFKEIKEICSQYAACTTHCPLWDEGCRYFEETGVYPSEWTEKMYGIEIVLEGGIKDELYWKKEMDRDSSLDHIDLVLDDSTCTSIRLYADTGEWIGNKFKVIRAKAIKSGVMDIGAKKNE